MNRQLLFSMATIMILFLTWNTAGCNKKGAPQAERMTARELFNTKCTRCHGGEQATKLHGTEESFLDLIKRMTKKGAELSDKEVMSIAKFLSSPNRYLFDTSCTKCHEMDKVLVAHKTGTLTKETIIKMREKGAKVKDEDIEKIMEFLDESLVQPEG